MSAPHFLTLDAPVDAHDVDRFLPVLSAALDGSGPAILPLPAESPRRERLLELVQPVEPLEAADTALLVPTSGSTGRAKIALLPRQALVASAQATHDALGGPGRWLLALPLTHIAGLQVLTRSIVSGFPPVQVDSESGFRPAELAEAAGRLLDDIGPEPRYAALVPTQLHRVLEQGGSAVSALMALDAVLLGGSAPPAGLVERAHAAGITLVQTYGMTETCGGCVYDGAPLRGVHVSLRADNQICLSGRVLFAGYRGDPERTRECLQNGMFLTNDIGHFDAHDRLVVDGRVDDIVVSGGVNVSCTEVWQVLSKHPDVVEIAITTAPDREWGQRVVAVAVVRSQLSLSSLRSFAAGLLEPAALPQQLVVVERLPMLATGKPDTVAIQRLARGATTNP